MMFVPGLSETLRLFNGGEGGVIRSRRPYGVALVEGAGVKKNFWKWRGGGAVSSRVKDDGGRRWDLGGYIEVNVGEGFEVISGVAVGREARWARWARMDTFGRF